MRLRVDARNASVGIQGGRIVEAAGMFDRVIRVPDGELRPGLINAHDHLHRNHYGRLGDPPYPDAYAWGRDIHARRAAEIERGGRLPRGEALRLGAWKNLFAGVTTVVHHDPWEPAFERDFPLRVARCRTVHSLGFDDAGVRRARADAAPSGSPPPATPLCIHLAEGVDGAAAEEVRQLDRLGLLDERLLAVHAVGVDDDGVGRLRRAGAGVVWCPTSNLFLFGRTLPPALVAAGIDVLVGSDSLLTAEGDLLDEIRAARRLALIDDDRIAGAVGATAARRLRLPPPTLEVGAAADLVVLRRPLLEASAADVALVVVAGEVRLADPALADLEGIGLLEDPATLRGVTRRVSGALPEVERDARLQRRAAPRSSVQPRRA